MSNLKAMVAEFIGTFALIFVGVGAIAANELSKGASGLTGIALAHGLTIAVMVSATAAISGGHLNPAVTFGAFVAGKIPALRALLYVIAQCLGGIIAAFFIISVVPSSALIEVNLGVPSIGEGVVTSQALMAEIILTFFLVFVVFGTGIDVRAPKVGGLFIGLTVTLDILIGGPISGAAMNPARHLGPALMAGSFSNMWLYWIGPLVGGALAALVYHRILED